MSRRRVIQAAALTPLGIAADAGYAGRKSRPVNFVLVHGAWHGGWCYARVADILRLRGHRVFTPTLTGLGERSHLANLGVINCSTHIQDVVNVIRWEQLTDVVLCGHSYGGMVIGGVADAMPEQIAALVYLDAVVPQAGRSGMDNVEPRQALDILKEVADHGGNMRPALPAELFNVNAADRAMVDALCTPQPFATFVERLDLTGAHLAVAKKVFVRATDWSGTAALLEVHERLKADKSWQTFEIPSGHDVMLDAPERVAEILLGAARGRA